MGTLLRKSEGVHDEEAFHHRSELRFVSLAETRKGALVGAALCLVLLAGCSASGERPGSDATTDPGSPDYLRGQAEQWAEYYGVEDPPAVEVVRYVDTPNAMLRSGTASPRPDTRRSPTAE